MNTLYYGDNLEILREYIDDESVDLAYLDPPFNSQTTYNILFKEPTGKPSTAQITAFEDTWHWGEEAEKTFQEIVDNACIDIVEMMRAFRSFIKSNDMMSYLTMMCIRLIELKRVLRNTGSICLHCDPTASHYLKVLMDAIFGKKNFCNEIIWHYRKWPSGNRQFQRNHDVILFYSKTEARDRIFNQIDLMDRTASTLKRFGKSKIISGHDKEGKRSPSQISDIESSGVPRDDVWDISRVPPIKQLFPTQKPESLLSRIIRATTKKGDIVLDSFCGCGTTILESQKEGRRWIGIDITHLAINTIKLRLKQTMGLHADKDYKVIGEPTDLEGANVLASQNRYQFQWWALSLIDARPYGDKKKGKDTGVDGYIYFQVSSNNYEKIVVQVKSGNVSVKDIRDLGHVTDREQAKMGIFITLRKPTRDMKKEAVTKGYYALETMGEAHAKYPKLQILTIEELLQGKQPQLPVIKGSSFKQAKSVSKTDHLQAEF